MWLQRIIVQMVHLKYVTGRGMPFTFNQKWILLRARSDTHSCANNHTREFTRTKLHAWSRCMQFWLD